MAIKKSQLYSTLWKSCDELRGGMDMSQYKTISYYFILPIIHLLENNQKINESSRTQ